MFRKPNFIQHFVFVGNRRLENAFVVSTNGNYASLFKKSVDRMPGEVQHTHRDGVGSRTDFDGYFLFGAELDVRFTELDAVPQAARLEVDYVLRLRIQIRLFCEVHQGRQPIIPGVFEQVLLLAEFRPLRIPAKIQSNHLVLWLVHRSLLCFGQLQIFFGLFDRPRPVYADDEPDVYLLLFDVLVLAYGFMHCFYLHIFGGVPFAMA